LKKLDVITMHGQIEWDENSKYAQEGFERASQGQMEAGVRSERGKHGVKWISLVVVVIGCCHWLLSLAAVACC
jgi:hypothetical protein